MSILDDITEYRNEKRAMCGLADELGSIINSSDFVKVGSPEDKALRAKEDAAEKKRMASLVRKMLIAANSKQPELAVEKVLRKLFDEMLEEVG